MRADTHKTLLDLPCHIRIDHSQIVNQGVVKSKMIKFKKLIYAFRPSSCQKVSNLGIIQTKLLTKANYLVVLMK